MTETPNDRLEDVTTYLTDLHLRRLALLESAMEYAEESKRLKARSHTLFLCTVALFVAGMALMVIVAVAGATA